MYFWREWDAIKSVKYVEAALVNHDGRLYRLAGLSVLKNFLLDQCVISINLSEKRSFLKSPFKRSALNSLTDNNENWSNSFNATSTKG